MLKPSPFGAAIGEGLKPVGALTSKFAKSNASAGADWADQKFGDENGSKFSKGVAWMGRLAGTRSGDKRRNP